MKPVGFSLKEALKEELAYLNRIYNLFVWGCIGAAWFTIAVIAYEMAAEKGLL